MAYTAMDFTALTTLTAAEMDTMAANDAYFNTALVDGWRLVSSSWSYASASTITVPTNATLTYSIGDRIRIKQGAGYKYFTVAGVAATLITVLVNTNYTVANSAITDIWVAKRLPLDFPLGSNIGYAQITSDFVTGTFVNTPTDITGLTTTFIAPTNGQLVKVTVNVSAIMGSAGAPDLMLLKLQESTTVLQIAQSQATANNRLNTVLTYVGLFAAGSHTLKATIDHNNSGTITVFAAATAPSFILVELL